MRITKHYPNQYSYNKSIQYLEVDFINDENHDVFGFSLDSDFHIIGRVVLNNTDIDEYTHLKHFLSKNC